MRTQILLILIILSISITGCKKETVNPDKLNTDEKEAGTNLSGSYLPLNDKTANDYEVKVIYNSNDTFKFEFNMISHPSLDGDKHIRAYKKGLGFVGNWKEIKINNNTYKY